MTRDSNNDAGEHSSDRPPFGNLYETMLRCLQNCDTPRRQAWCVIRLARITPDLAVLPNVQKWIVLLELAISLDLPNIKPITTTRLYYGLGVLRLQSGQYAQALAAFETMYELADKLGHPKFRCDAQTGSVVAGMYLNAHTYTEEQAVAMLSYQRTQITSPDMLYRFKQALGFIQYYWHQFDTGINLLEEVALYWKQKSNPIETGRTAYVLALMYRGDLKFEEAIRCLDEAEVALRDTEYIWQYAAVANENGTLALYERDFESAIHWHRTALAELNKIQSIYSEQRLSVSHMCLGIALVYQGTNLQEAHRQFAEVYRLAENQPYSIGKYQSYHGFAFAHFRGGDHLMAREYALKGREMTEELPKDLPFRANMLTNYDDLINAIDADCNPLDLLPYPKMPQRFGSSR